MELACSYCPALVELIHEGLAPIDRIEVGPWFTVQQIEAARAALPAYKFHFHDSNLHLNVGWRPGAFRQIQAYHAVTDSPFASFHISLLPPGTVRLTKYGFPTPKIPPQRLIRLARDIQDALGKAVILENMPGMPRYLAEAHPAFITRILSESDCGFLLDTGHAKIAASLLSMDIYDYLRAFPLERIVQLHVHRPGLGRHHEPVDTHEALQEDDYALIAWLLTHSQPKIVTLEYWRDKTAMREQLARLRQFMPSPR